MSVKVGSYHFKGPGEAWKVSWRPKREDCRSGQSPAGEQGYCSWAPGPGPRTCSSLPTSVAMGLRVERSQFHQKLAGWKISQQLYPATRKGNIFKLIVPSLVLGVDVGTTNFLRAAMNKMTCCGSLK